MKRRLVFMITLVMVLFAGCARAEPVWETVDDEIAAVGEAGEPPMVIVFDVPEGAELLEETEARRVYGQPGGDYEIVAQTISADSLAQAVCAVAGCAEAQMRAVLRDGEGRYSLGWYSAGDGGRVCRTELLSDRTHYYALTFRVRENAGTTYDSTEEAVFASFGLIS